MDDKDAVRRIAEMDQASAGMAHLNKLTSEFYKALRREKIPRALAYALTRDFMARLMGGGVSQ